MTYDPPSGTVEPDSPIGRLDAEALRSMREHGIKLIQASPRDRPVTFPRLGQPAVEEPTFTASEVKELTTKATEVALALGRKEAAEEIAAAIDRREDDARRVELRCQKAGDRQGSAEWFSIATGYMRSAELAREIASRPSQAAPEAQIAPTGHSDLPPTPEARKTEDFIQPWPRIHQAQLDAAKRNGWIEFHPEHYCHRCGGRNISWHVDSEHWNRVMRPAGETGRWGEIICPTCFVDLAGNPHVELVPRLPEGRDQ